MQQRVIISSSFLGGCRVLGWCDRHIEAVTTAFSLKLDISCRDLTFDLSWYIESSARVICAGWAENSSRFLLKLVILDLIFSGFWIKASASWTVSRRLHEVFVPAILWWNLHRSILTLLSFPAVGARKRKRVNLIIQSLLALEIDTNIYLRRFDLCRSRLGLWSAVKVFFRKVTPSPSPPAE